LALPFSACQGQGRGSGRVCGGPRGWERSEGLGEARLPGYLLLVLLCHLALILHLQQDLLQLLVLLLQRLGGCLFLSVHGEEREVASDGVTDSSFCPS
jgi:hypothetical protein